MLGPQEFAFESVFTNHHGALVRRATGMTSRVALVNAASRGRKRLPTSTGVGLGAAVATGAMLADAAGVGVEVCPLQPTRTRTVNESAAARRNILASTCAPRRRPELSGSPGVMADAEPPMSLHRWRLAAGLFSRRHVRSPGGGRRNSLEVNNSSALARLLRDLRTGASAHLPPPPRRGVLRSTRRTCGARRRVSSATTAVATCRNRARPAAIPPNLFSSTEFLSSRGVSPRVPRRRREPAGQGLAPTRIFEPTVRLAFS
jgi:hypothetical protein